MNTFNDLFNMCEAVENDGIMNAQVDDIVEIISFAKTVLGNLLWFTENYEDENPTDAVHRHKMDAIITLTNIFDELEYYSMED